MDRRSFLGALAALPIVAKMGMVKEEMLTEIAPNIIPPDMPCGTGAMPDGSGAAFHYPKCSG